MSRKALGRGLKALIPDIENPPDRNLMELEIDRIIPGRFQPRQDIDPEGIKELARSIKSRGIIQPVVVQPSGGQSYELIAGERRWRAAQEAGLKTLPALVRKTDEVEALELALIENIQREDLNPIESARAYRQLRDTFHLSQEEIAAQVGKDRSSVANHLRLLKLPSEIQENLSSGQLSMGHARALLSLQGREKQLRASKTIISRGLSVRETERMCGRILGPGPKKSPKKAKKDIFINELEGWMRRSLGTKVTIQPGKTGGTIEIKYFSNAELERLTEKITGEIMQ